MSLIQQKFKEIKEFYSSHKTYTSSFRKAQLEAFIKCLNENENEFVNALTKDLKSQNEALLEVRYCLSEAIRAHDCLDSWMRPKKVETTIVTKLDKAFVKPEPIGITLVLAPWNYPLALALEPLIGAISAGCASIVKPSELSPNTAEAICSLMPKYLDTKCYGFFNGGVEVAQELLSLPFDFIFYTGGPAVGKKVLEAASKNLTPVVLELGGKSPCIVSRETDLDNVVGRIVWGKCLNSGQTCIAPDYILCEEVILDEFVKKLCAKIVSQYGSDPLKSADYGRIINHRNFDRLSGILEEVKQFVVHGGSVDRNERFISPTVIVKPPIDSKIMTEEIFGPLLPIIAVSNVKEAVKFINDREKPLALYIFSKNSKEVDFVINHTSSGGVCVNDVFMHTLLHSLPFGGVGNSGMGKYHGKASFDAFSHNKSVLWKPSGMEFLNESLRYAPNTLKKSSFLMSLMFNRSLPKRRLQYGLAAVLLLGAALLIGYKIRDGFKN